MLYFTLVYFTSIVYVCLLLTPCQNWDRAIRQWYNEVAYLPSTYVDRYQPKASGKDIGHYGQVRLSRS